MPFIILAVLSWPVVSLLVASVYVIFRIRFTRTGTDNYRAYRKHHAKR